MNVPQLNLHIYAAKRDLPRDLQDYVESVPGSALTVFKHPLWTDILPLAMPMPIEELLREKRQKLDDLLDKDDLNAFVFWHERAFRMDVLSDLWISGTFDHRPKLYWQIARQVWVDSEMDEGDLRWTDLLEVPLPDRESMTTPEEWDALDKEPDTLTLYRGVHGYNMEDATASCTHGWSWSLSQNTARFFARRLLMNGQRGFVAKAQAPKVKVIAHLLSRGEAEIVISPNDIDVDSLTISAV